MEQTGGAIIAAMGLVVIAALNYSLIHAIGAKSLDRNHVFGIRTKATMRDDESWLLAHTTAEPALRGALVVAVVLVPVVLLARVDWLSAGVVLVPAMLMAIGAIQGDRAAKRHGHE